jgi:hypothetical protein
MTKSQQIARHLATDTANKPMAIAGLISYRAACPFGWIMIGARDDDDALVQARRSRASVQPEDIQVWDGQQYVACVPEQPEFIREKP